MTTLTDLAAPMSTGSPAISQPAVAVNVVIFLAVVTVMIKVALDGWETTRTHTFSTGSIWLAMAVTLAVQQLVLLRRATTLTPTRPHTPR